VLVVNNHSRAVEAYLGSADFQDASSQGQVDGVRAIRSPGSTLKPFLYALAMDRGLVTPKLKLPDVPSNFNGFRPENFDKSCGGEVTVERALTYSLNIPAVRVLAELGVPAFTDQLRAAGFRSVARHAPRLGLSTILGGCGATLEELTGLYVSLADEGHYAPLTLVRNRNEELRMKNEELGSDNSSFLIPHSSLNRPHSSSLISKAAAFLVTNILAQRSRPDLPLGYEGGTRLPKIAWKTGTSYGRRDAWSIGYNQDYTIGVWVGNFSGQGSPALTGTDIATPLLFDLFNALAYNSPNNWRRPPASLDFRLVCAETGLVPGEHCPNQLIDYYLPGVSSARHCEHQQEVLVSADGLTAYCRACVPEAGFRRQLFPNPLPEVLAFREAQGLPAQRLPAHNAACRLVRNADDTGAALAITSPVANAEYLLSRGEKQQLLLSCAAGSEVRQVYWYVNDRFLRAAKATERVFFRPPSGPVKVSCADDHGRNVDVQVLVGEI
jgi:penicillin-binding protein 1C